MKKILLIPVRLVAAFFFLLAIIFCVFSVSPIYDFAEPEPFSGPDIYNPYAGISGRPEWKRANFHTHTRVKGIMNECPEWPDVVYRDYERLGYDILTFSNHNELTVHPFDSSLQVNVYEHGYNVFKFHMLVFNPSRMILWDPLLPLFVSQKQWEYDYLSHNADFIVMNHPDYTRHTTSRSLRLLTGYRMIEADSGKGTDLLYWDEVLSAGHYTHCLIGDDCHDSGNHRKIARRCTWLNSPSARYEDLRPVLLSGCFYSMRVPDFGDGDPELKAAGNASLPRVEGIGVRSDTVFIRLSEPARIEAWGQDHTLLAETEGESLSCVLGQDAPYLRFTAYFDNGVVIYSNAFARFDSSVGDSPYRESPHKVNVLLTLLFNAGLLALLLVFVRLFLLALPHKEHKS